MLNALVLTGARCLPGGRHNTETYQHLLIPLLQEVHTRSYGPPPGSNPLHPSRGPLAAILPLFPRRLQFPTPPILRGRPNISEVRGR